MNPKQVVRDFSQLVYDSRAYAKLHYRGIPCLQYATDLWVLGELLDRVQPQFVIETGTFAGGTALFMADRLRALGLTDSRVLTVDVEDWSGSAGLPCDPMICYLRGSSVDPDIVGDIASNVLPGSTCLVVLDSNHHRDHVLRELNAYAGLVSVGSYLIVNDTCVHDVMPDYGPGPDDAVAQWVPGQLAFVVDREPERLLLSQNPGGYLLRVKVG